jgi:hypothetical protein
MMKNLFSWYFPPNTDEIQKIWDEGILTVDTNVLLDLYRYHEVTQRALLNSLNEFQGRAWICYQVADEFFRNRHGVILSAEVTFNDANRNLLEVKKTIEEPLKKLKNNRIIPTDVISELENTINIAVEAAESRINQIKSDYPDYRKDDPILEQICKLFDSNVGAQFEKEAFPEVIKEAKRRKENKIPPGFKDANKDGDKAYGDYIIWRQVMNHVKSLGRPLIFITSEQKEDWWEKSSGKTVGPLYELLKEFHEETGQRFLLYRTDRFLEFSIEKSGLKDNSSAIAEIRDVVQQRYKDTSLIRIIGQSETTIGTEIANGILAVELREQTYRFTCSGHFEPELSGVPELKVTLISCPNGTPKHYIRSGTGTTFDFNIHIKSNEYGVLLPLGDYVFEYEAIVDTSKI